jgi:hypothetical protein
MNKLDPGLLAALRQAAGHPTRALQRVGSWPPADYRPPPPATAKQVRGSERRLGFRLPAVVRQAFSSVANGGFGPGYGLLGLEGGAGDHQGRTAVDSYVRWQSWNGEQGWYWPERLLPICGWGCGICSCVNCELGGGVRVVRYDPGLHDRGHRRGRMVFVDEGRSLVEWLRGWLDGEDLWSLPAADAGEAGNHDPAGARSQDQPRLFSQ